MLFLHREIKSGENNKFYCERGNPKMKPNNPPELCPFILQIKKDHSILDAKFCVVTYTSEHNHDLDEKYEEEKKKNPDFIPQVIKDEHYDYCNEHIDSIAKKFKKARPGRTGQGNK